MLDAHARMLMEWFGEAHGCRELRKHTSWYLKGYAVGTGHPEGAGLGGHGRASSTTCSRSLPPDLPAHPGAGRMVRGHTNGPRRVVLPEGWLDHPDDAIAAGRRGRSRRLGRVDRVPVGCRRGWCRSGTLELARAAHEVGGHMYDPARGYPNIVPYLTYPGRGGRGAVAGPRVRLQGAPPADAGAAGRATPSCASAGRVVMLGVAGDRFGSLSSLTQVFVDDVDQVCNRAVAAGGEVHEPPSTSRGGCARR